MPKKVLGIEFAPLNVPLKRRLETIAAFTWIAVPIILPLISWIVFFYVLLCTSYFYLALMYLVHYYYDQDTPNCGARILEPVRNFRIWKHLKDYFTLQTVKTAEIPPNRNYIFCIYPHGVLSASAATNFAMNGTDFHEKFPGLTTYCATLDLHFRTPLARDFLLSLGLISSSKRSLLHVLSMETKGQAIALAVGGAQEALYAKPGNHKIVLANRKGFIKLALRTGSSIVPSYAFGENDLYDQVANPPGSLLFRFQEWTRKKTGFSPVIFLGRGFFQYSIGIIPMRRPLTTVFGAPIDLPHEPEPTEESVEKYHKIFTESLIQLFEDHKKNCIENSDDVHLEIY